MNLLKVISLTGMVAIIMASGFLTARAMTMLRYVVTGTLTVSSAGDVLTLDGHVYRIRSGSPAVAAARKLQTGTVVDALMSGPANTSRSEVVYVKQHSAR